MCAVQTTVAAAPAAARIAAAPQTPVMRRSTTQPQAKSSAGP